MQRHPEIASDLLKRVPFLIKGAVEIPYCHHEKWSGDGYPRGLKGEEIPLSARIFSVIDVFDAVTSSRPYRAETWERERALAHIESESGKSFDPDVVKAFLEMMKEDSP
jgi:HD-GYP domain-containing protein (c-di-GMP phosphodiesterase class II)